MNPDSDSIIELGTMQHPYKQVAYAFVEVLNYHSHSDRNITIYLMEYTRNELRVESGYAINITYVEIKPYTLRSAEPDKANLIGMDEGETLATPSTLFSILKSYELKFDDAVTNNNDITDLEKQKLSLESYLILIIRSSLSLINLELTSEYADINSNHLYTYPVYLQHSQMTFMDLHIGISGTILKSTDPLNLHLENIDVDYYRNSAGFELSTE